MAHQHSIFCILPPQILHSIAKNGTPQQRTLALQVLSTDHTFRTLRTIHSLMAITRTKAPLSFAIEAGHIQRTIFDAHNTTTRISDVVRTEGASSSNDPAVNAAYDGLGYTFAYYWEIYKRNSIDDRGQPLHAVVHYGDKYDNAFWDGERMVFGDGDGEFFNSFTSSLDVIGHELTHGVTSNEANLVYLNQSGALNESFSDVHGSLIKQFSAKPQQTADQADWLIGSGCFTERVQGVALRSMKAPGTAYDDPILGKDIQPAHMRDYVYTSEDSGGVHINSGIPNHAFYLLAVHLGGFAWEKAGRIWYQTMRDIRLRPIADFAAFAQLTLANADQLYGYGSRESQTTKDAWNEVGVTIS